VNIRSQGYFPEVSLKVTLCIANRPDQSSLATMRFSDFGEWLAPGPGFSLVRAKIRNDPTLSRRETMGRLGLRFAPPSRLAACCSTVKTASGIIRTRGA